MSASRPLERRTYQDLMLRMFDALVREATQVTEAAELTFMLCSGESSLGMSLSMSSPREEYQGAPVLGNAELWRFRNSCIASLRMSLSTTWYSWIYMSIVSLSTTWYSWIYMSIVGV
jgi:hypothetical protein